ncbi:MAG TPA: hypothetical protein VF472_21760 [Burkholderiaceae bacterium]
MRGHKSIIAARRDGLKPSTIFFEVDLPQIPLEKRFPFEDPENYLQTKQHAHVEMSMADEWRTMDWRFASGCHVIMQADQWSDELVELAEKLVTAGAPMVFVASQSTPEMLHFHDGAWEAYA